MPKVLSRQPRWLDFNSPGFDFFQPDNKDKLKENAAQAHRDGPIRKIAHRGTELFVAVGNELRWSDLAILKEAGEGEETRYGRLGDSSKQAAYKILRTPAARPILQLSVSPSGDLIAIATSHTCHICVLPPSEHLQFKDIQPIKLRSYQVGPTAHVLEQAPLVSIVWHPLSPSGNGLVTVTKDACVRLWELDQNNRSTFNEPALAVDLKKLANAVTAREDFSASKYGSNKGFSVDEVEMQVAGSCFGGEGREDEDGWSSMTLWLAMTEGDVYALCPFLPSKFWAPPTLLPSLSTSVVAKQRVLEQDRLAPELQRMIAQQQSQWLAELDQQDPVTVPGDYTMDVLSRPERGAIARLQGPFQLSPEPDFGEITDIHVIAPKLNDDALFDDEEEFELPGQDGLGIGIICLATSTSKVHICLNVDGVEGEWLPTKRTRKHYLDDIDAVKDLLLFQTIDLTRKDQGNENWFPTLTASPSDRYELLSTQPTGVYSMSFRPWITGLESELSAAGDATEGVGFRLSVLLDSSTTTVDTITTNFEEPLHGVSAAVAVRDNSGADVGYVILTAAGNQPFVAVLDLPTADTNPYAPDNPAPIESLVTAELRAPYQPAEALFQQSALPAQLAAWRRESVTGTSGNVNGQITFSNFTLERFTEAHRILSSETHTLGTAAGDLLRGCERTISEMRAQVEKVRELLNRVNSVTGEDEFPEQAARGPELVRGGRERIQSRIQARQEKTEEIKDRVDRLRKKMRGLGSKELSAKEKAFMEELEKLEQSILPSNDAPTGPVSILKMENSDLTTSTESRSSDAEEPDSLASRFQAVQDVYKQLSAQVVAVQKDLDARGDSSRSSNAGGRSANYRQQKLVEVFALLERETALVDAVNERLNRLTLAAR